MGGLLGRLIGGANLWFFATIFLLGTGFGGVALSQYDARFVIPGREAAAAKTASELTAIKGAYATLRAATAAADAASERQRQIGADALAAYRDAVARGEAAQTRTISELQQRNRDYEALRAAAGPGDGPVWPMSDDIRQFLHRE